MCGERPAVHVDTGYLCAVNSRAIPEPMSPRDRIAMRGRLDADIVLLGVGCRLLVGVGDGFLLGVCFGYVV